MTLTDSQGIVALAIVVAVIVSIVLICAGDGEPSPPDADHVPRKYSPSAERARRLEQLRQAAKDQMAALGIKTLLEGRPAWAKVNPMGKEEGVDPELDLQVVEDNVVLIRRRV